MGYGIWELARGARLRCSIFYLPSSIFGLPGQRPAFEEFHAEELLAVVFADLVDRDDVRVVQVGRRLGFGLEALEFGFGGELAGANHLQRDDAVEGPVARLIDDPHAAAGDGFQQFVVAEAAPLQHLRTFVLRRFRFQD
jgi:hypothetical protein